jgi:subtilase family serine protease
MGLPAAQLTIVGTPTESAFSGDANAGWADETTLDVEWVHAIAPGAKILLVVTPTNSFDDLFKGILTAAMTPGVVAISNSWSGYESGTDVPLRQAGDQILMLANARGKAVNFATGDEGNETYDLSYVDVNYPASSPYATAIGGVSVGLDANKNISFQSSWGNNITEIADTIALGSPPIDPPFNEGFVYGGGGGVSNVYPKPRFQSGLAGQRRLLPDISWTADPYTGVEIIITGDAQGDQFISAIGGTSLATPMFSALWGIAAQRAHHPLGQAAPYLYRLPPGAITDVNAVATSADNVTGVLSDANGTFPQTSWDLALPLQGQATFFSALYNSPHSTRWFVLTFGTDSALQAGPGWDPATGLGTPNGWNFVQAFAHGDE